MNNDEMEICTRIFVSMRRGLQDGFLVEVLSQSAYIVILADFVEWPLFFSGFCFVLSVSLTVLLRLALVFQTIKHFNILFPDLLFQYLFEFI